MRVLGVDGCRDGWVGIALGGRELRAYAAAGLLALVAAAEGDGGVDLVGVDIPIGLADGGWRQADGLAADALGPRRASIFRTPVRAALQAPDHAGGVRVNRRVTGAGFSIQAWGLAAKILEVDLLVRGGDDWIFEVHPELTFSELAGRPARHPKKTWAGQQERLALLAAAGIDLARLVGGTGGAAPDDVVDAAAAAWSAQRLALGTALSRPDPPEPMPYGLRAAIWT